MTETQRDVDAAIAGLRAERAANARRVLRVDALKPVMLTDQNGMTGWFLDVDDVRNALWGADYDE